MERPTSSSNVPGDLESREFLRRLRAGDAAAMETFLQRYQDRLFNVVLRIVSNPDDAADITQEALVHMLQSIHQFSGQSSLYTWVYRIAVNQALSHGRKAQVRRTVSLNRMDGNGEPVGSQPCAGPGSDPAHRVEIKLDHQRVIEALNGLPVDYRTVLVLRDVDGCDYDQIEKITDWPIGTIKSRLFRARQALRAMLENAPHAPAAPVVAGAVSAVGPKAGEK